jgi:hypothetical protein
MQRKIIILTEYPQDCALYEGEIDELITFIRRILSSYYSSDHKTSITVTDEYGPRTIDQDGNLS